MERVKKSGMLIILSIIVLLCIGCSEKEDITPSELKTQIINYAAQSLPKDFTYRTYIEDHGSYDCTVVSIEDCYIGSTLQYFKAPIHDGYLTVNIDCIYYPKNHSPKFYKCQAKIPFDDIVIKGGYLYSVYIHWEFIEEQIIVK